ncbi:MAG TPA: hypothetical protein VJC03_06270, partial [bacterium]|nr:hypothetical protein [bacterium]
RFQCRWLAVNVFGTIKEPRRRPGIFLAVEASQRQDFFENAKAVVKNWFKTAGISYKGELFCSGVESKGAINEHPGCLQRAEELGKKIAGGGIL